MNTPGVQSVAFLVVAVAALALLVRLLEPRMAFFPTRGEQGTPAAHGVTYEPLVLDTADGETIHGWMLRHPTPRATIVYWHGNGGNLSVWLDQLLAIYHRQLTVVAIDYRGYGLSSGRPSERGVYLDTDALLDRVRAERDARETPIVYWGRSLGGPIAAYAASVLPPDGLILESTFPSVRAMLASNLVMRILGMFATYRFPTLERARRYDGPILVMHGDRDDVVPYHLGVALHAGLPEPAALARIAGGGHNDLHSATAPGYWAPVDRLLDAATRYRAGRS